MTHTVQFLSVVFLLASAYSMFELEPSNSSVWLALTMISSSLAGITSTRRSNAAGIGRSGVPFTVPTARTRTPRRRLSSYSATPLCSSVGRRC